MLCVTKNGNKLVKQLNPEKEIYESIELRLVKKLAKDNFKITKQENHPEIFGSRYTLWKNETKRFAIRLIWDGKESCFIVEESPFMKDREPISWADLVIVPFDSKNENSKYYQEIIDSVINEIK